MLNQIKDILDELRMLTKVVESQSAAINTCSDSFFKRIDDEFEPWHVTNLINSASSRQNLLRRLWREVRTSTSR